MNLGSVLRGAVVLGSDSNGPTLGRAAVTFGEGDPAFSDAQTVNVGGNIGELDLAGWLNLFGGAPGGGGDAMVKRSKPLAAYFRGATFEVSKIDYMGLSFSDVPVAISQANGGWRIRHRRSERRRVHPIAGGAGTFRTVGSRVSSA